MFNVIIIIINYCMYIIYSCIMIIVIRIMIIVSTSTTLPQTLPPPVSWPGWNPHWPPCCWCGCGWPGCR